MNLLWLTLGDRNKASSRVRAYWVAERLRPWGVESAVIPTMSRLGLARAAISIPHHDCIVFQKASSRWHLHLMRRARRAGARVVFDLDDFPSPTFEQATIARAEEAIRAADLVTVGSPALLKWASSLTARVTLIPTSVELRHYNQVEPPGNSPLTFGWIGNGRQYAEDLIKTLVEPLTKVASEFPCHLRLVGSLGDTRLKAGFERIPGLKTRFIDAVDWSSPGATAEAMRGCDVGLYPLMENRFNQYKCGFKGLEYLALGMPLIASATGSHPHIFGKIKGSILCSTQEEWSSAALSLAKNDHMRRCMGIEGRRDVETHYSTERVAELFYRTLESL